MKVIHVNTILNFFYFSLKNIFEKRPPNSEKLLVEESENKDGTVQVNELIFSFQ